MWTFTVRALDSSPPERTVHVNYDGFAEGRAVINMFVLCGVEFFIVSDNFHWW